MNDLLTLLRLRITTMVWDTFDYLKVIMNDYSDPQFAVCDLRLLGRYLLHSPFQLSKHFLEQRKTKAIYTYGETPLTTFAEIADWAGITAGDHVYELGCGRGRTCFWLRCRIGCKVVGVDMVPEFIAIAKEVAEKQRLDGIEFLETDMLDVDLSAATVIYLFENSLADPFIKRLCARIPDGAKVITVSYPLTDYEPDRFHVLKHTTGRFNWGETDVYLQEAARR